MAEPLSVVTSPSMTSAPGCFGPTLGTCAATAPSIGLSAKAPRAAIRPFTRMGRIVFAVKRSRTNSPQPDENREARLANRLGWQFSTSLINLQSFDLRSIHEIELFNPLGQMAIDEYDRAPAGIVSSTRNSFSRTMLRLEKPPQSVLTHLDPRNRLEQLLQFVDVLRLDFVVRQEEAKSSRPPL